MYTKYFLSVVTLLSLATTVHAADPTIQNFISNTTTFLGRTIIPALLALAFLFLAFNVMRYFILEADNEDGREKARSLAIYGTLTFVIIVIFWGIINFLAGSLGADRCSQPMTDYERARFIGPLLPECP